MINWLFSNGRITYIRNEHFCNTLNKNKSKTNKSNTHTHTQNSDQNSLFQNGQNKKIKIIPVSFFSILKWCRRYSGKAVRKRVLKRFKHDIPTLTDHVQDGTFLSQLKKKSNWNKTYHCLKIGIISSLWSTVLQYKVKNTPFSVLTISCPVLHGDCPSGHPPKYLLYTFHSCAKYYTYTGLTLMQKNKKTTYKLQ